MQPQALVGPLRAKGAQRRPKAESAPSRRQTTRRWPPSSAARCVCVCLGEGNNFIIGGAVKGGKIHGKYPDDLTSKGKLNVGRGQCGGGGNVG